MAEQLLYDMKRMLGGNPAVFGGTQIAPHIEEYGGGGGEPGSSTPFDNDLNPGWADVPVYINPGAGPNPSAGPDPIIIGGDPIDPFPELPSEGGWGGGGGGGGGGVGGSGGGGGGSTPNPLLPEDPEDSGESVSPIEVAVEGKSSAMVAESTGPAFTAAQVESRAYGDELVSVSGKWIQLAQGVMDVVVRPMPVMPGLPSPGLQQSDGVLSLTSFSQLVMDGSSLWVAGQNSQVPYDLAQAPQPEPIAIDPVYLADGGPVPAHHAVVMTGVATFDDAAMFI